LPKLNQTAITNRFATLRIATATRIGARIGTRACVDSRGVFAIDVIDGYARRCVDPDRDESIASARTRQSFAKPAWARPNSPPNLPG